MDVGKYGFQANYSYPGHVASMPYFAYWGERTGLYLGVHDPDGNRLRVRLTGINAPESVHEDESKNTEEGRQASQFMKELMADVDVVYLEYDEAQFDQYERTLAYVWIDIDGTYVMVNEILLATDYAEPVYIKPNLRYADIFRQYEG